MKKKTNRSFDIKAPLELLPLYNFLQNEMNKILSDPTYRKLIMEATLEGRNTDRQILQRYLGFPHKKWDKVNNAGWYGLMLYENLVHIRRSLDDKIVIATLLKANNWKSNKEIYDKIKELGIYTTMGHLKNICKSKKEPELPYQKTFNMDYSVFGKGQNLTQLKNNLFEIEYSLEKGVRKTLLYEVFVPLSVRKNKDLSFTAMLNKPKFIYTKEKGFIGRQSYEIRLTPRDKPNVLGVDLGQVKLYSAVVLNTVTQYIKEEFVPSKEVERNENKLEKLWNAYESAVNKNEIAEKFNNFNIELHKPQENREDYAKEVREKISNIKKETVKIAAREIVDLAVEHNCGIIALENLAWTADLSGKWNHSEFQSWIKEFAELESIKVIKVSAKNTSQEHPITGQIFNKERNRQKVFETRDLKGNLISEEVIDRDYLAAINIAKRGYIKFLENNEMEIKLEIRFKINNKHKVNKVKRKVTNNQVVKGMKVPYQHILITKREHPVVCFSTTSNVTKKNSNVMWGHVLTYQTKTKNECYVASLMGIPPVSVCY